MNWASRLMKTNILLKDKRWAEVPLEKIAESALKLVIENFLENKIHFEVSILASNDTKIREFNKNFRGQKTITNIISWPEHELQPKQPGHFPEKLDKSKFDTEGTIFLGNLAISYERCSTEAKEKNVNFEDHMLHLLLHGFLHLVGFDHQNDLDANVMENIEIKLLSGVGIKNPYELNDQ